MTIQASIYGRLGRDPQQRQTKNSNNMVTTSIAVAVTGSSETPETIWLQVLAFGKTADSMMKHSKGDLVSLSGRITQSRWAGSDGEERTSLTLMADTLISARTARPNAGRKKTDDKPTSSGPMDRHKAVANNEFDDPIPF